MSQHEPERVEADTTFTVERRYIVPGLIMGVIAVMAITVMFVQYLPFMTRQEAAAANEVIVQRIAHNELNEANDEQRIAKLEDHYVDIQMQLGTIDTNLAKLSQQVTDNEGARAQRGNGIR